MKVIEGNLYRNFKRGTDYVVLTIGSDADVVGRSMVTYQAIDDGKVYTRELVSFTERFEHVGRLSRRTYFHINVRSVAFRGTCSRRKVGAIAVLGKRILATGYNGAPEGSPHCNHEAYDEDKLDPDLLVINGRYSCARAVHAEMNVVGQAAKYGVSLKGSTVFCDTYPCLNCLKAMLSAGVVAVDFMSDYTNDPMVEKIASETGFVINNRD